MTMHTAKRTGRRRPCLPLLLLIVLAAVPATEATAPAPTSIRPAKTPPTPAPETRTPPVAVSSAPTTAPVVSPETSPPTFIRPAKTATPAPPAGESPAPTSIRPAKTPPTPAPETRTPPAAVSSAPTTTPVESPETSPPTFIRPAKTAAPATSSPPAPRPETTSAPLPTAVSSMTAAPTTVPTTASDTTTTPSTPQAPLSCAMVDAIPATDTMTVLTEAGTDTSRVAVRATSTEVPDIFLVNLLDTHPDARDESGTVYVNTTPLGSDVCSNPLTLAPSSHEACSTPTSTIFSFTIHKPGVYVVCHKASGHSTLISNTTATTLLKEGIIGASVTTPSALIEPIVGETAVLSVRGIGSNLYDVRIVSETNAVVQSTKMQEEFTGLVDSGLFVETAFMGFAPNEVGMHFVSDLHENTFNFTVHNAYRMKLSRWSSTMNVFNYSDYSAEKYVIITSYDVVQWHAALYGVRGSNESNKQGGTVILDGKVLWLQTMYPEDIVELEGIVLKGAVVVQATPWSLREWQGGGTDYEAEMESVYVQYMTPHTMYSNPLASTAYRNQTWGTAELPSSASILTAPFLTVSDGAVFEATISSSVSLHSSQTVYFAIPLKTAGNGGTEHPTNRGVLNAHSLHIGRSVHCLPLFYPRTTDLSSIWQGEVRPFSIVSPAPLSVSGDVTIDGMEDEVMQSIEQRTEVTIPDEMLAKAGAADVCTSIESKAYPVVLGDLLGKVSSGVHISGMEVGSAVRVVVLEGAEVVIGFVKGGDIVTNLAGNANMAILGQNSTSFSTETREGTLSFGATTTTTQHLSASINITSDRFSLCGATVTTKMAALTPQTTLFLNGSFEDTSVVTITSASVVLAAGGVPSPPITITADTVLWNIEAFHFSTEVTFLPLAGPLGHLSSTESTLGLYGDAVHTTEPNTVNINSHLKQTVVYGREETGLGVSQNIVTNTLVVLEKVEFSGEIDISASPSTVSGGDVSHAVFLGALQMRCVASACIAPANTIELASTAVLTVTKPSEMKGSFVVRENASLALNLQAPQTPGPALTLGNLTVYGALQISANQNNVRVENFALHGSYAAVFTCKEATLEVEGVAKVMEGGSFVQNGVSQWEATESVASLLRASQMEVVETAVYKGVSFIGTVVYSFVSDDDALYIKLEARGAGTENVLSHILAGPSALLVFVVFACMNSFCGSLKNLISRPKVHPELPVRVLIRPNNAVMLLQYVFEAAMFCAVAFLEKVPWGWGFQKGVQSYVLLEGLPEAVSLLGAVLAFVLTLCAASKSLFGRSSFASQTLEARFFTGFYQIVSFFVFPILLLLAQPLSCSMIEREGRYVSVMTHFEDIECWTDAHSDVESVLPVLISLVAAPVLICCTFFAMHEMATPLGHPPFLVRELRVKKTFECARFLCVYIQVLLVRCYAQDRRDLQKLLWASAGLQLAYCTLCATTSPCLFQNVNRIRTVLQCIPFIAVVLSAILVSTHSNEVFYFSCISENIPASWMQLSAAATVVVLLIIWCIFGGKIGNEGNPSNDTERSILAKSVALRRLRGSIVDAKHRASAALRPGSSSTLYSASLWGEAQLERTKISVMHQTYNTQCAKFLSLCERLALPYYLNAHQENLADDHREYSWVAFFHALNTEPTEQYEGWVKGQLLGRGSFGSVYLALLPLGTILAVKVVELNDAPKQPSETTLEKPFLNKADAQLCEDMSSLDLRRVQQEVEFIRELAHPNVIQYKTCILDCAARSAFIFMEYAAGGSLASVAKKCDQKLPEAAVARYMRDVLNGVSFLHAKGVIHRDIKGENVLLDGDNVAKLADFGCSKELASATQVHGSMAGSPYWMAPEVLINKGYNAKADIWSTACTAIEVLNRGELPWKERDSAFAVMHSIAQGGTMPDNRPEQLSDACGEFLDRCFNRSLELRPSAEECLSHPWLAAAPTLKAAKASIQQVRFEEEIEYFTGGYSVHSLSSAASSVAVPIGEYMGSTPSALSEDVLSVQASACDAYGSALPHDDDDAGPYIHKDNTPPQEMTEFPSENDDLIPLV